MSGPDTPSVMQADRDLAEQICGCATAEQRLGDAKAIARHREQAEAASKAREAELVEALENLVIAVGMDWELHGVVDAAKKALAKHKDAQP